MEEEAIRSAPHIVLFPSPGMGHVIPLVELAKLLRRHNVSSTIITLSGFSSETEQSFLATLPASITHLPLDHLPSEANTSGSTFSTIKQSLPSLRNALLNLQTATSLLAVVTDLITAVSLSVAKELRIPSYILYTSTFMHLSLILHLPVVSSSTEPLISLPGCIPFAREHLPDPIRDPNHPLHPIMFYLSELYHEADGILVNSFEAVEPGACRAFEEKPAIYPVGPLVRSGDDVSAECLKWLDRQRDGSVVFVSFGSLWELSVKQAEELAFGLEMSGHRFLWVVRSGGGGDPLELLPEGFMERTRGTQGMVVAWWVPQAAVLGHGAVGGFVTHCGWNSALESLVHGVPMVAWPLQYDQMMNAVLLVEGVGVALRPSDAIEEGVVGREAVCEAVRELMEGERGRAARARVGDLREAALVAAAEEGSSAKVLAEVVALWKSKMQRQ